MNIANVTEEVDFHTIEQKHNYTMKQQLFVFISSGHTGNPHVDVWSPSVGRTCNQQSGGLSLRSTCKLTTGGTLDHLYISGSVTGGFKWYPDHDPRAAVTCSALSRRTTSSIR